MPTTPTTSTSAATEVAVVYCRVSSDRQAAEDRDSLNQQERDGLETARTHALPVLYTVKSAESAWVLEKRSRFQAVLDDAKAARFQVLIVDRMNRLTRSEDLGEYFQVRTELREAGVRVLFSSREYEQSGTGQLLQAVDAYVSGQEQENRRKQAMVGKRARVQRHGHPIPSGWPRYGYIWDDAQKTRLAFDPGDSQIIMRRIWDHFLYADSPTLAGLAKRLNREGITTPRAYRGVKTPAKQVAGGPRWTAETIRSFVRDPLYSGGDEHGQVLAFQYAEHNAPTPIPAYAPAYVTREEQERVLARFGHNRKFAKRHRTNTAPTLLHAGLAKCGHCGWRLAVHTNCRDRLDGTRLVSYRCAHANTVGTHACPGGSISAEVLDAAVVDLLDREINRGQFLDRLFAAWDADAEAVQGSVRTIETTLAETEQQVANAMARVATYAPGDALSAPLEAHARLLAQTLPGLRERLQHARSAMARAKRNPHLRAELGEWFSAWLGGFTELRQERKRDFLIAIGAVVTLWPEGMHTPRAVLSIALPSSVGLLPPLPVDLAEGQALVAAGREMRERGTTFVGHPRAPGVWETGSTDEIMAEVAVATGANSSSLSRCPRKATAAGR